jgi:hypothetical protein
MDGAFNVSFAASEKIQSPMMLESQWKGQITDGLTERR